MKRGIVLTIFILTALNTQLAWSAKRQKDIEFLDQCQSTREYITAVRFLRKKKDFSLDEKQVRTIADKVSLGCTGASKRFIIITNLLVKTGLDSKSAIEMGVKFASKSELEMKTFSYIYKRSFLKSYLDLDIRTSIEIAYSLADKFNGKHTNSQRTFNQVLRLCNNREQLDLPNKKCANLAARVAKAGEKYKKPLGDGFRSLFNYLIRKSGPNLPTFQAVEMSEVVMRSGPMSAKNFIQAYKFALSKNGLNVPRGKALEFAKKMGTRTLPTEAKNSAAGK